MPRYLLDTNILSDWIRHPQGAAARRLAQVGELAVCTSLVVACELRYGAEKKGSARLSERVEAMLGSLEVLPLGSGIDTHYGQIRHHLEQSGQPIGPNDLLIAAHARALGLTLVTANLDEFRRVPGLEVESWLESPP
jgi:tRNA(fMet)-specific endonuclease VapC